MRPTNDQLQRYLLSAERAPVEAETAAWARRVLEDALQRAQRADRAHSLPPRPEPMTWHTR
jgi:hypothetical protein